jgi:hypothetical protein
MATRAGEARVAIGMGSQLALFDTLERASADTTFAYDTWSPSNDGHAGLTLGQAARIIREAVKDKSYRSTPLGQLVGRYMR